jgi:predicted phage-related endonuclease
MASTIDYWVNDPTRGPGIMEIKLVRWSIWLDQWTDIKPPAHISLQVQHQLACAGFSWGAIAALVVGEGPLEPFWYLTEPDQAVIGVIEARISEFWDRVRRNDPPPVTGTEREYDILRALHPEIKKDVTITSEDDTLADDARIMRWAQDQNSANDKTVATIKTKLAAVMGDADLLMMPTAGVRRRKHGKGWRFEVFDRAPPAGNPVNSGAW